MVEGRNAPACDGALGGGATGGAGTGRRCAALALGLAFGVLTLLASTPRAGAEDQRCKGTKQFYAGKCRYPDEIGRLRDEEKKRREAAEEAKRKAEQQRLEQERAAADQQACKEAETAGSKQAWDQYLAAHGDGTCAERARAAIAELEAADEPVGPAPVAPPGPSDPSGDAASSGAWEPNTLFWIGAGVTAVGAITWIVAGGILVGKSSDLEEQCPAQRCAPEREEDLQSAEVTAHVTTVGAVLTGVGAAVTLVGALWPLFEPEPADGEAPNDTARAALRITPLVGVPFVGVLAQY